MAKENTKRIGGSNAIYIIGGIVFAIVMAISIVEFTIVSTMLRSDLSDAQSVNSAVYVIKEDLITVNRDILQMIAGVGDATSLANEIDDLFADIERNMDIYERTDYHSKQELTRYEQAKSYISAFKSRYDTYSDKFTTLPEEEAKNVYLQEIATYQNSALSMFDATVENNIMFSREEQAHGKAVSQRVVIIMAALLVAGEAGIFVAARIAKKAKEEAERQERQAEAANRRFKSSQEKISDIAYTNILTDMKNRYALENDIGKRLDTESFHIAAFNMDNFRSVNDIYGYDFGDEYLVQISDRLKAASNDFCEIYNITGNEFCVVYNNDVNDMQADRHNQEIYAILTTVYNVANVGIQLPCSGCTYHYIAGECANLSAVLVKMDNVIRNVKRNGGNMVVPVVNM